MTQVIDFIGGEYRNRTGVHGFAIRCVTTPPTRLWCLDRARSALGYRSVCLTFVLRTVKSFFKVMWISAPD